MATYKHLTDLLKICSVLPALAIMPAMAKTVDISDDTVIENQTNSDGSNQNAAGLTLSYGDKLSTNGANNVVFKNNSSVNSGGAMKALNGFVAGDGWTFEGNHSDKMSGGLYVKIPETYTGVDPENINRDVIFGKNTTFTGNSSTWLGGALGIESAGTVTIGDNATFESNSTEADGGAIAIWTDKSNGATTGTELTLGRTDFAENTAANRGGAIANLNNDKPENKTDFYNTVNIASGSTFTSNSAAEGGAIYNLGTMNVGAKFTENTAKHGGAIFNAASGKITGISNALFQNNKAENNKDAKADLEGDVYAQGGAIYNLGTIGTINGDFVNNSAHTTSETASKATANGGALSLYQSTIDSINGNFIDNTATAEIVGDNKDYSDDMVSKEKFVSAGGGAIHIEGKWATGDVTKIGAINGNFERNSATGDAYANGGAIYIKAGSNTDVSIDKINGNFLNNKVVATTDNTDIKKTSTGGAISIKESGDYNATVAINGDFIGNSVTTNQTVANGGAIYNEGDLTVNGDFINNYASSQLADNGANGGAIYNSGILKLAENLTFSGNKADYAGGAIYSAGVIDKISNVLFKENEGYLAGAINNSNLIGENQGGYIGEISNSQFIGNKGGTSQGGAIRNQGRIAKITDVLFSGNTAGNGGALNNGTWGSLIDSVTNVDFIGNVATGGAGQGGAIVNAGKIALIDGSNFSDNRADVKGGAIANVKPSTTDETEIATITLKDTNFTGNIAGEMGGAIYNHERGEIVLNGKNTFSGNMVGSVANDIHNDGKFSIASGTTTLGGGITGDGTLTIANGATLNIGTTTVKQSEVTLDGTLTAQILNQGSYGRVETGNITVGDNGLLNLMFGSVGTYNFGVTVPEDKIVYNNAIYDATFGETGEITVATKSVEEIAQGTNLSMGAANAVSIMANTKDDVLNTISLMAQQDLVAGKTGNAEKELAKLNPDDKPVAQSVASSVQNQVMSLAAGRMSGASVGRSGGDLTSADYGLWVQGLYNHSKYNGKFSGDTWGISVGADTLIDGKYTLGIGYAYNDTDVDSNSRDTGIESNSLFLYGQYKPNEWYVNAALNYTMANYDESADPYGFKRKTEYDVDSFGGQIMTGYDFASGFTPEVGMRYLHISQDAYQSWLGEVDALDTDYLTGVAGVKYAFEIESASELKFRPELRAAATYDFMSDAAVATVTAPGNVAYVIDADRLSRFGGEFGIGLTAQYRGLDVSLNYELDLHEDYTSQTGMLKFRYDF